MWLQKLHHGWWKWTKLQNLGQPSSGHWLPTVSESDSEEEAHLRGVLHLQSTALCANTVKISLRASSPWGHVTTDLGSLGILSGNVRRQNTHGTLSNVWKCWITMPITGTNTTFYVDYKKNSVINHSKTRNLSQNQAIFYCVFGMQNSIASNTKSSFNASLKSLKWKEKWWK